MIHRSSRDDRLRREVRRFPLLLVHGWPETRRIWSRNVEPLADAGFDVVAPDLRGFGDSAVADRTASTTSRPTPRDLDALMRVARARALRRLRRRPRRRRSSATWVCGSPASSRARCSSTARCRSSPGTPKLAAADRAGRGLLSCARAATPTRSPPSCARPRNGVALRRRRSTARASGPRRERSPARRSHATPSRSPTPTKLRAGFGNYEAAVGAIPMSAPPRFFERDLGADAGALRPRRPRDPAGLPRALRGGLRGPRRPVRRSTAPGTSCSGSARSCSTAR